jgi:8-oxo-dGTP pyrophosphatase MutT (NUDIX family)
MIDFVANTIQLHIAAFDVISNEHKFLILQRSASKIPYPNLWQAITGTIEEPETAVQTAVRECFEEIGLRIKANQLWNLPFVSKYYIPKTNKIGFVPTFGLIIDLNSSIQISKEHQNYRWINQSEFQELAGLPSHAEANLIFEKYILNNPSNEHFKIKL